MITAILIITVLNFLVNLYTKGVINTMNRNQVVLHRRIMETQEFVKKA